LIERELAIVQQRGMSSFEKHAQKIINQHQIPGVGLGINIDGKRVYDKGFGYRDVEQQLQVTEDTVFGIASMTKSFACVAIMQLQEAGKLSVHDPVKTYLPNFRVPHPTYTDQITIHHLMTHTSGLPPLKTHVFARKRSIDADPSAKDYGLTLTDNEGDPIDTFDELIDYLANADYEMLGEPGTEYSYSNDTYGLLGAIIEKVSGESFEDYMQDHIFKPCGMTRSFILLDELENFKDNMTELYVAKQSENGTTVYAAPLWWDAPAMRAAGYIKSTVNDILKYLNSFIDDGDGTILSQESIKQMFYPHVEYEPGKFYGYGFRVTPNYVNGMTLIDHGGGLKAVSSMMCLIPEKGMSGVVLTNLSGVPAGDILLGAVNQTIDQPFDYLPRHFEEESISQEALKAMTGTYKSGEGMKVTFIIDDEKLAIQSNAKVEHLRYVGEHMFVQPSSDRIIRFITNDDGEINRVFYQSRQIYKTK